MTTEARKPNAEKWGYGICQYCKLKFPKRDPNHFANTTCSATCRLHLAKRWTIK